MDKLQVYNFFKEKKNLNRGILLTVEGVDGVGKNTQVKKMASYLKSLGYKVKTISFPRYERPVGQVISSFLRGEYGSASEVPRELICIAYASDRAGMRDEINSYLENGYIVISDRYTYSNLFSAAKMPKEERKEFIQWVEKIEFNEMKVVKPDYNFFLYITPETSAQRIRERGKREYQEGKDDIFENDFDLLSQTTETYIDWANENSDKWFLINQMKDGKQISVDEVFELIKKHIDDIVSKYDFKDRNE